MLTEPQVTDGRSATADAVIQCLNLAGDGTTYQRYSYISDTITREGVDTDHADGDGHPLGGSTFAGFEKGAISVRCAKVSYKLPVPGYIIDADFGDGSEYYRVTAQGRARTKGNVKTASIGVTRLYNPFPLQCLSEAYGSRKTYSQAAGTMAGAFASALTARNTRAGSTLAWSMAAHAGSTLPAGLSMNSSTGAITGTAVAGTHEIDIIITETLTGEETREGYGILALTIT
jgi:hypothetical protein